MAKRNSTEDKLTALRALESAPLSGEGEKLLREALASRNRELVARGASVARELELNRFCGEMAEAFAYLIENPAKDKGCLAKCALVETLDALEYDDDGLYASGLRHVQMEPVWGGREDTAAALRVKCAIALVRRNVPGILFHVADLLNDPQPEARRGAIRAIAYAGGRNGVMLRVFAGRMTDAADLSECLAGLMGCHAERSLPFVARFLEHENPAVAENAAIAMGSSRQHEAFEILKRHWEQTVMPERRDMLLLPIALVRSEDALRFLLRIVREANAAAAERALEALAILRDDEAARNAVQAAVRERDESRVRKAYARLFEDN